MFVSFFFLRILALLIAVSGVAGIDEEMIRDRMERLVLLPFSIGCSSESSVALGTTTDQSYRSRTKTDTINSLSSLAHPPSLLLSLLIHFNIALFSWFNDINSCEGTKEDDEESSSSDQSIKNSMRFLQSLPKPQISTGFHRLLKTFSHLFAYKEGMEDDDLEMDMEIGDPTDVQHVTHIGWDNLTGPELLSLPSHPSPPPPPTLKQFELSMAAQVDHHDHDALDLDRGLLKSSLRDESGF